MTTRRHQPRLTALLAFLLVGVFSTRAASPSFSQFDTNDFVTVSGVSVKNNTNANSAIGKIRANAALTITNTQSGANLNNLVAGGTLTISNSTTPVHLLSTNAGGGSLVLSNGDFVLRNGSVTTPDASGSRIGGVTLLNTNVSAFGVTGTNANFATLNSGPATNTTLNVTGTATITNISGAVFNVMSGKLLMNASGQTVLSDSSEVANGAGFCIFNTGRYGWASAGSVSFTTAADTYFTRSSAGNIQANTNVTALGGFTTGSTNTLAFTTVSFFTNTLGVNATAYFSAGASIVVTNEFNNVVVSIATPGTVQLHPNWKVSGTTMSATLVAQ